MPNPNKNRKSSKDPSDSEDEAHAPKDKRGSEDSTITVRAVCEEPDTPESPELEGAVGGVGVCRHGDASPPSSVSPNLYPDCDSEALISHDAVGNKKTSPLKDSLLWCTKSLKGMFKKVSPRKKSPTRVVNLLKPPKLNKSMKHIKPKPGFVYIEDIEGMEASNTGFKPYSKYTYDESSIKSIEDTDCTEAAEAGSFAEICSIPSDSSHASPAVRKPDNEEGTPKKVGKDDDEDSDVDEKEK